VALGKRTAKSSGRPGAKRSRRETSHRRVLTWLAGRWRNHQPKRAKKPHSIIQRSEKATGRPCYEAGNSACRGEWRREAGSPVEAGAPNVSAGKRAWRTPIPKFVPVQPQGWAGTFCLGFSGVRVDPQNEVGRWSVGVME
jgi:hypothetical protein